MDFFASQDLARRKTKWLVVYFVLAVVCMIVGIYAVVIIALGVSDVQIGQEGGKLYWFEPVILVAVTTLVSFVVGSGSLYKIMELRGGGVSVATTLGGRRLLPNSRDPEERRILNVVEEVALAAGTPVPPVYLLDEEQGINAFAAGYTIDDAVIGINRGTIHQLSRDELQGVIAHEFSHILNGDMRMSIRMMGVLHGIQILALIGYFVLRGFGAGRRSSRDNKGAGAILLIAVGLIVIGWAGLFFARIIKASVSRQREYLADASAVQFTRNPDGIAGALKMIGASQFGSQMKAPQAEVASHMYFASMFGRSFSGLFATHPPLVPRIQKVDPRFEGDFSEYAKTREKRLRKRQEKEQAKKQIRDFGFPKTPGQRILPPELADRLPIDPLILLAGIGVPNDDDFAYSKVVINKIPEKLLHSARDVFSARCIVLATLLDPDAEVRQRQLQMIHRSQGMSTVQDTMNLVDDVDAMEPRYRLPLFEIMQGTLAGMSPQQYEVFRQLVNQLVEADNKIDLFEFFLRHHLIVHLDRRFGKGLPPQIKFKRVELLADNIRLLLEVLVRVGHDDLPTTQAAFDAGLAEIQIPSVSLKTAIDQPIDFAALASGLDRLAAASYSIRKSVLAAAAIAITHDHIVTVEEAELFRAVSESLDCPVPPIVAT